MLNTNTVVGGGDDEEPGERGLGFKGMHFYWIAVGRVHGVVEHN